jgi:hypothetical protein
MNYPKYLSHKEVSAAKISAVDLGADGSVTVHLEGGFDNVVITHHDRKHKPEPVVGGYLVQYSDGYISFSPAAAFEEGYALVATDEAEHADNEDNSSQAEAEADKGTGPDAKDGDDDEEEDEEVITGTRMQEQTAGVAG